MAGQSKDSVELDFKQMMDRIMDAILILNDEKIVYSNKAANQLLSFDEQASLCGLSIGIFVNPSSMPLVRTALDKITFCHSDREAIQLTIHAGNNLEIPADLFLCPLHDEDRSLIQLTVRDISEQKAAEESFIQSERLSVIGELSAGIIHEIRNPLTSIKGFLQLMQSSGHLNRDYLTIMLREIEQIEKITTELLYFTKQKNEQFTIIDMNRIAAESLQLFEAHSKKQNITLHLQLNHEPHCVKGDRTQLKQVFVNLIKNAFEASPANGEITVRLASSDQWIEVDVQDTGSGIPEHLFDHLGKSFFTTKVTGTGLGLMVTYTIVKHHKGIISVSSEENKGTTFHLRFPKAVAEKNNVD